MDALRAVQLLTDTAYLCLGVAAIAAAMRSHERARVDVAILFGTLAASGILQEIRLLSCATPIGCIEVPGGTRLSTILRLVDDVHDVPRWQMWIALVLLIALAAVFAISGPTPPGWLVVVLAVYVVV